MYILQDQSECIPSSLAEESVAQGDLDIGVASDELDALFENPEQVRRVAEKALHAGIFGHCLDLAAVVLEYSANELANRDDCGTERNGAHVVAQSPPHAAAHSTAASCV